MHSGDKEFDAVDEATLSMPSTNTATEEVAPAAEAVAPASEAMPADIEAVAAAAPAAEVTPTSENDNQETEPAQ